jgi:hypothetical protein
MVKKMTSSENEKAKQITVVDCGALLDPSPALLAAKQFAYHCQHVVYVNVRVRTQKDGGSLIVRYIIHPTSHSAEIVDTVVLYMYDTTITKGG